MARAQLYVMPIVGGWAVNVHGDSTITDDSVVPLPLTEAVTYDDALEFVKALPMAADAMVDGWPTFDELEPELGARTGRMQGQTRRVLGAL